MIDPNDVSILPLLPQSLQERKRRGRAPTGKAKTAAQRKAAQRARDGWELVNATAAGSYGGITLTGLLEQLAVAVSTKNVSMAEAISKELLRRARQH